MALLEKKRYQGRRGRRQTKGKRRRPGLFVFVGLVILTLVALILFGPDRTSEDVGVVERVEDPTISEAPDAVSGDETDEEVTDEEELAVEDEEAAPVPPDDATMYLTIPKLGINNAFVDDSEAALELGAQHMAETGYPWLPGSNTYIAGHRVGFPGTGSDRIFFSLPSMAEGDEIFLRDSNGREYTYRVSEVFAVTPFDLWVTEPTGSDMITLQACTETPDDWSTIGPSLMSSGPESGRLIVRGELVS
jgi:sortase (surface protein transpeptidase)